MQDIDLHDINIKNGQARLLGIDENLLCRKVWTEITGNFPRFPSNRTKIAVM